jgi:hypothetical protein
LFYQEVSVSTKGVESELLKDMMRKGTGAKAIRNKMQEYVNALKTEFRFEKLQRFVTFTR